MYPNSSNLGKKQTNKQNKTKQNKNKQTKQNKQKWELIETTFKHALHLFQEEA